jgi:hypothetical protein
MPTINFPSSPYDGQTYSYNGRTWYWNGYAWDVSTSTSGGGGGTAIQYLDQLEDVGIIDPYVGQALVYNGTEWVNENVVNSVNSATGDIIALSDYPTPYSGVTFDANLGTISNLSEIYGNDGVTATLTVNGNLVVTGNISAPTPGTTITGNTVDTDPDNIDAGTYS